MGGAAAAIEAGVFQKEIQDAAFEAQRDLESGKRIVVGVNRFEERFEEDEGNNPAPLRVDPKIETEQVERLRRLRARRDAASVQTRLQAVEDAARSDRNLLPPILDAVEADATVGEISDALRKVFGVYRESVVI